MRIAVTALGKIGLPLAVQFAGQGHQVIGVDTNAHVVKLVNEGVEPFPGEADLARRLSEVVGNGSRAATAVAAVVQPGTLLSYETTLPVGATRDGFGPMLEAGSRLKVGQDLFLVFSPERVFTGRVFADLRKYPKLVGGVGADSTRRGVAFYEVIEACNSQGFSHIHQPGIAVGGHCIPVYPRLYLWNDPTATVVSAAREANAAMPQYAIGILAQGYRGLTEAKVAVLGASYRGGVRRPCYRVSRCCSMAAALRKPRRLAVGEPCRPGCAKPARPESPRAGVSDHGAADDRSVS